MAPAKKSKAVPGLSFDITVTPKRNGMPWPGVEPITTHWDQAITQWHEHTPDVGVMVVLRDVEQRVRRSLQPRARTRK